MTLYLNYYSWVLLLFNSQEPYQQNQKMCDYPTSCLFNWIRKSLHIIENQYLSKGYIFHLIGRHTSASNSLTNNSKNQYFKVQGCVAGF